jgi:hypothetical protein
MLLGSAAVLATTHVSDRLCWTVVSGGHNCLGYKEHFTAKLKRWLITGTIRCTPRPPGTAVAPGCHADGRTEPPRQCPPRLQPDIQAPITGLNTRLAALDDDLDTTLRASPVWREHEVIGGGESAAWRACLALGRMRGSPPEIRVFVLQ